MTSEILDLENFGGTPVVGTLGEKIVLAFKALDRQVTDLEGRNNFLSGNSMPPYTLGKNGDVFLNTCNLVLYRKEYGCWGQIVAINGANGAPRPSASQWHFGDSFPSDNFGSNGDIYFNRHEYKLYFKNDDYWLMQVDFRGLFLFRVPSPPPPPPFGRSELKKELIKEITEELEAKLLPAKKRKEISALKKQVEELQIQSGAIEWVSPA